MPSGKELNSHRIMKRKPKMHCKKESGGNVRALKAERYSKECESLCSCGDWTSRTTSQRNKIKLN